jgi:hypothetical protein
VVFDLTDGSGCDKNLSVARPHRISRIPWRVQGKLAKFAVATALRLTFRELVAVNLPGSVRFRRADQILRVVIDE